MKTRHDFSGTLAATAASLDWLWAIEPMFARQAYLRLSMVDATSHRNAYEQSGERMGFSDDWENGGMPEHIRKNRQAYMDAMNIGDLYGMNLPEFAKNVDGSRKSFPVDNGVALMKITGVMQKADAHSMEDSGTNTVRARRVIRQAKNDKDVKAAIIRFDGPGGTVAGNEDLARDVRQLAETKPTYGYIDDLSASANYYVASQCNAIYANPGSLIGSIASLITTYDYSAMFEAMGVESVVIAPDNAPFKGTGAMGSVLTQDQRDYLQHIVTDSANTFRNAVKRGRNMTDEELAKVWDGRVFPAREARSLKLIDGITSYDNVLATLKKVKTA